MTTTHALQKGPTEIMGGPAVPGALVPVLERACARADGLQGLPTRLAHRACALSEKIDALSGEGSPKQEDFGDSDDPQAALDRIGQYTNQLADVMA